MINYVHLTEGLVLCGCGRLQGARLEITAPALTIGARLWTVFMEVLKWGAGLLVYLLVAFIVESAD
jgi:hypothetical protein